ncbi:MAG: DUF4416 family protein [Pirellulaceae bacterium]
MAVAKPQLPALRFAAIFGQKTASIDWGRDRAVESWGPSVLESEDFEFDQTNYYRDTMGEGLHKRLVAFEELIDPTELVASKLLANQLESEFRETYPGTVMRPVNIDPGYLTEAKVVLATMKDRDHRLYLGDGVFGEVTLYFQLPGKWVDSRWTYPDYRRPEYHEFFFRCRDHLRQCLQELARAT